ncbi:cysteine proteinase, partial [Lepidopterella palustris CBS 459.81]
PAVVDWRNRWGTNFLAFPQAQGRCACCWAFATTALLESMVRIQHGIWSKRSEADLLESSGRNCAKGWNFEGALDWIGHEGDGLADATCDIYYDSDRPYLACGDRTGRTLKIGDYYKLASVDDQKRWLAEVGPITAGIIAYDDFSHWDPSKGVYTYDGKSQKNRAHGMLIVGYDDTRSCWIVRNSWGSDWGDAGYGYIKYGEVEIDSYSKYGITNINPDHWTRRRHSNGNFYQSGDGATHRNFELLRRTKAGDMVPLTRIGEEPFTWTVGKPIDIGTFERGKGGVAGQPVIIETSFNRTKEAVYWLKEDLTLAHWYHSNPQDTWWETPAIGTGDFFYSIFGYGEVTGYPGFIQNDNSDFTVVARLRLNGNQSLGEFTRSITTGEFVLKRFVTDSNISQSGPSLVQSNIGLDIYDPSTAGNMYVVAVLNSGELQMWWRRATDEAWVEGETFGSGVGDTPPVMIQDFWDTANESSYGGFQLLVASNGHVEHWQRLNNDIIENPPVAGGSGKWEPVDTFGDGIVHVWGLVQGSFNQALEAIVEDNDGELWHWQYTGTWKQVAKLPSA